MAVYEYHCQKCDRRFSVAVKGFNPPAGVACSACGGTDVSRVFSTFAYHKSMKTVWEESGGPSNNPGLDFYKDPRNIGRAAEKTFAKMGMEMPGEIKQQIEAAREGELPDPLKE